jgi:hypothetical protein
MIIPRWFILLLLVMTGISFATTSDTVRADITATGITEVVSGVQTNAQTYVYAPGHVSFTIPAYWHIIPERKLQSYKDKYKKMFPGSPMPKYVVGMQRNALFTFSLPYALVELQQGSMPTLEEIQSETTTFDSSVRRAYIPLHRQGLFGEIKALPAEYDPTRHVILGYSEMTRGSDNIRMAAITAIYPCRYGYLRFHFFINTEYRDRDMPAIDDIISSVTFKEEYAYVPRRESVSSKQMRRILYTIIAVLACAWFGLRILGRRSRGREPFSH